jgi:hypothetical protein
MHARQDAKKEPPYCARCGRDIDVKNRDSFVCRKRGLTPGEYSYMHWACVKPRQNSRYV